MVRKKQAAPAPARTPRDIVEDGIRCESIRKITFALLHLKKAAQDEMFELVEQTKPELLKAVKTHHKATKILVDAGASVGAALDVMDSWQPDAPYFCLDLRFGRSRSNSEPCVLMVIRGGKVQATTHKRSSDARIMFASFYREENT